MLSATTASMRASRSRPPLAAGAAGAAAAAGAGAAATGAATTGAGATGAATGAAAMGAGATGAATGATEGAGAATTWGRGCGVDRSGACWTGAWTVTVRAVVGRTCPVAMAVSPCSAVSTLWRKATWLSAMAFW